MYLILAVPIQWQVVGRWEMLGAARLLKYCGTSGVRCEKLWAAGMPKY